MVRLMVEIPKDLRYAKTHEWARAEKDMVRIGITDFAQGELSDIVFVELPKVGQDILAGKEMGVVESVKSASDLYAPVSGTVVEVNDKLAKSPELINKSPHKDGWLVVVKPKNPEELKALMDAAAYEKAIKETHH
jgi:glycine cleavage system H protein